MCGIVYFKSFDNSKVNKRIIKQYAAQAHRGQEGFGFYLPQTDKLRHSPHENRIKALLKRTPGDEILFHHRFPTSTANVRNACHPFSTKDFFGKKQYIMVHNGYLYNEYDLQRDHQKLGISYVSLQPNGDFNDSEALLYDLGLYLSGRQPKLSARGAIAFIVIEREGGVATKLHFGRNTSPLNMELTDKGLSLSSEGKGKAIEPQTLYTFDYATGQISTKPLTISSAYSSGWSSPTTSTERSYSYMHDERGIVPFTPSAPQMTNIYSNASDLLVESSTYPEAIRRAKTYMARAESELMKLELLQDYANKKGELDRNINDQMEQIALFEHWSEVVEVLEDWRGEDDTFRQRKLDITEGKPVNV